MKKVVGVVLFCSVFASHILAQDIADVSTKARFERSKSIYLSFGGIGQSALGDYSSSLTSNLIFEAGFMKRLNKVMSIGGSLSYFGLKYDPSKTHPYYYDDISDQTIILSLAGGDLSLLSAGVNFKLNLIPVSDNSKFSIYAIGTPFVSYYSRTEVKGNGDWYDWNSTSNAYDIFNTNDPWSAADGYPALKAESKVTGGVYVGVGIELFPAKPVSFFVQPFLGYTFPVSFVSTSSYLHPEHVANTLQPDLDQSHTWYNDNSTLKRSYFNDSFPIISKGFAAYGVKFGVAYNF